MPTENRSSTIEQHDHIEGIIDMVSVPREPTREMLAAAQEVNGIFPTWRAMLATAPASQSHAEPYGWAHDDGKEFTTHADHASDLQREGIQMLPLYTHADPGEVERLRTVIEQQRSLIASLREELVESRSIDARAEPGPTIWDCRPCQLEQPTARPCDVCGGKTELAGAKP